MTRPFLPPVLAALVLAAACDGAPSSTSPASSSVTSTGSSEGGSSAMGGMGGAVTSSAGGSGGTGGDGGSGGSGGQGNGATLTAKWQLQLSGGQAFSRAVAIGPSGEVVVAGVFDGTIDFGGGPLPSSGDDVFVAAYDVNGNHLFSKAFGDAEVDNVGGVAIDASGNVVIAGAFVGTIDFGGGPLAATGSQFSDVYVVKLDPAGQHLWSNRYGDINSQEATSLAVDSSGAIVVAGTFQNDVDFGGGAHTTGGDRDAFLVKLDAAGAHVWSKAFGDSALQSGLAVAVATDGTIGFGGVTEGNVDLGGGVITNTNGEQAFWARYDAFGSHISSSVLEGGPSRIAAVAFAPSGHLVAVGTFQGSIDLGAGSLPAQGGNDDLFLARYDVGGALVAGSVHGDGAPQKPLAVGAGPQGIVVAGRFIGTLALGGASLVSQGGYDGFVIRTGLEPASLRFGDGLYQAATAIAVDTTGRIVVAGDFAGTISLGLAPMTGTADAFLASF